MDPSSPALTRSIALLTNALTSPAPRHKAWISLASLVAVVMLAVASPTAQAAAAPVLASADAYTVSSSPQTNNGANTKVAVGTNSGQRVGYVTFPAASLTSSNQVELQLTIDGGTAGTIRVHSVTSAWKEATLTHANAPAAGTLLGTVAVAGGRQVVKTVLPRPAATGSTISIALQRTDGGISRVASREAGSSGAPRMTDTGSAVAPPAATSCTVSAKLVPSCGVWFGVSANPLGSESWDQAFLNFEKKAGRPMDLMHYYKSGQSAMFPTTHDIKRQNEAGARRILFYNWKPSGLTWRQVADGRADAYLKKLAQHMKANATKPFFLSLNAEMEDEVKTTAGSGQTAKDFAAFYRHVVQVLRSNGVTNAVMVMNYIGIQKWGEMPWFGDLYPGNDVVDWIAQDPYSFGAPPVWLTGMAGMVNRTDNAKTWPGFYHWAAAKYPDKPQMLAEFGVDEDKAYPSHKANFWRTAEADLRKLPKIKALAYWDANAKTKVGTTRIDSKTSSLDAFRAFVGSDYIMDPRRSYLK